MCCWFVLRFKCIAGRLHCRKLLSSQQHHHGCMHTWFDVSHADRTDCLRCWNVLPCSLDLCIALSCRCVLSGWHILRQRQYLSFWHLLRTWIYCPQFLSDWFVLSQYDDPIDLCIGIILPGLLNCSFSM